MTHGARNVGRGVLAGLILAVALGAAGSAPAAGRPDLSGLPLSFEPNRGQSPSAVLFQGRGKDGALFLTKDAAVLSLPRAPRPDGAGEAALPSPDVVRLEWVGGAPQSVRGEGRLPGTVSHFRGRDPERWQKGLPTFSRIRFEDLYPGVDAVFYGAARRLEVDFAVAPGRDPGRILLRAKDGMGKPLSLSLDDGGNLKAGLGGGEFLLAKPRSYQVIRGTTKEVDSRFVARGKGAFGIEVGPYDPSEPLIVDPVLSYSTFVGGTSPDDGASIASDAAGNIYVAGETDSPDFPVTGPPLYGGSSDAFLLKLDPTGQTVLYCVYLGGNDSDSAEGVAVNAGDFPVLTGKTKSPDFPLASPAQAAPGGQTDAFVTEFNNDGASLIFSTYLGGTGLDSGHAVSCTSDGIAVEGVKGNGTTFTGFPLISLGQPAGDDILVAWFSSTGTLWDLYILGGTGQERAGGCFAFRTTGAEPITELLLTGQTRSSDFPATGSFAPPFQYSLKGSSDAFVCQIPMGFSYLDFSTYLGGTSDETGAGIARSSSGVFVVGYTSSVNFPLSPGAFQLVKGGMYDAFAAQLDLNGSTLIYGTYLGGTYNDEATGVAVDGSGRAFISGYTSSSNFPTVDAIQPSCASCPSSNADAFLSVLNPLGTALDFSTFLGGGGWDEAHGVALDPDGAPWLTGLTYSTDFPTASPIQPALAGTGPLAEDAFVSKISLSSQPCSFSCAASASPSAGLGPLSVAFTASVTTQQGCTGVPTYAWDFGDGGTSASQNPSHTYLYAGVYNWTVTLAFGAATCSQSGTVTVCDLICDATADKAFGYPPLVVLFTGSASFSSTACHDPLTFLWDFGDGTTSTAQSPSHLYTAPGYYGWSFTASSGGTDCTVWGMVDVDETRPGQPFGWGSNARGQVGDGTGVERHQPVSVANLTHVVALAAGADHSLAVLSDGTVWAWGRNDKGQIGDGTFTDRLAPVQVTTTGSMFKVAGGGGHSLALRSDQTVWSWGANDSGQIGDGTNTQRALPVEVSALPAAQQVSAGLLHSLALSGGAVYAWGSNADGQLGDGTNTDRWMPVALSLPSAYAIAAGGRHSLALAYPVQGARAGERENLTYGMVLAWGANDRGQLGQGDTVPRNAPTVVPTASGAEAIAAGGSHSLALLPDGTVLAWGANDSGQLGDGTTTDRWAPVLVTGLTNVKAIAAGASHSLALKWDGTLWAWGANVSGQLGHGDTAIHTTPVQVLGLDGVELAAAGGAHSLALATCALSCEPQVPGAALAGSAVPFSGNFVAGALCAGTAAFHWDFGDGATSALQNPSHVYSDVGSYVWSFTVTVGSTTCTQEGTIDICSLSCSVLKTSPENPWPPATFSFTATVVLTGPCACTPDIAWDFGDGGSGEGATVSHTYEQPGTFTWTLTAGDACGLLCTQTGTVTVCGLTCAASASPSSGIAPLAVSFTGSAAVTGPCAGSPAYDWDFGDGSAHSSLQNPAHTYAAPGNYTWTLTVTQGGVSCTRTGTVVVIPCLVSCSATVSPPAGSTQTVFSFQGSVGHPHCPGAETFDWDFGDGSAHSQLQNPTHTYASAGIYTWTFAATVQGTTCRRSGRLLVAPSGAGTLQGYVGFCAPQGFLPLNGPGVSGLQVYALDPAGSRTDAVVAGARYLFPSLPDGSYDLYARFTYEDKVLVDGQSIGGADCSAQTLLKEVTSAPLGVAIPSATFANICLPPPLVMLHGALQCFRWWTGDPQRWDDYARARGFVSFTPNYDWTSASSWGERARQVLEQVEEDLAGLSAPPPTLRESSGLPSIPWALLGYDMGGMVARVLTGGPLRDEPAVSLISAVYLLATPNSGSEALLGGGLASPLNPRTVIRRFNAQFPDFGEKTDKVYAIGGSEDWWGQGNSDGMVSLTSAFVILRIQCVERQGRTLCRPYPALVFPSGAGHVFPYSHYELGATESADAVLGGVILPGVAESAPERAVWNPESPVGQTVWGTNARTTGGGQHTLPPGGFAETEVSDDILVGATDGMAVVAFVSQGSGRFQLLDASGNILDDQPGVAGSYLYTRLNPGAGLYRLRVTPDAGGVTYRWTSFEDATYTAEGYVGADSYAPGESALLRMDFGGDLTNVAVSSATAYVYDSGGSLLASLPLYDDGQHGDGDAADGAFGATYPAPAPGVYSVVFRASGTYLGAETSSFSADALVVTPATHLFTGSFSDAPVDEDASGLYDALGFTADLNLGQAGSYGVTGDLLDAEGNYLDHASAAVEAAAPGPAQATLLFNLTGSHCVQYGRPFQVANLQVLSGATLQAADAWSTPVATAAYEPGSFECLPGIPNPRLLALLPDQAAPGQARDVLLTGRGFQEGLQLSAGTGVAVSQLQRLSDTLLSARLTVDAQAAVGFRDSTVLNPDGGTDTLAQAFEVVPDQPPAVALLTPESGAVLGSSPVMVTASASDDLRVTRVVFLLDGVVKATVTDFPFQWTLSPSSVAAGAHTVTARAYDALDQHREAAATVYKDPPSVSSLRGGGSPWKITVTGANFRPGIAAYIGSDTQPWTNMKYKSTTLIKLKGGKTLKNRFPVGQAVSIRLVNTDGTFVVTSYTR